MLYTFDLLSGAYIGTREEAPGDRDRFGNLVALGVTLIAPPETSSGRHPKWEGTAWSLVPDHRGETWWTADGVPFPIMDIGDPAGFDPPLTAEASALPAIAAPVPSTVYDYQFAGQACAEGIIDFEAAKAWTGSGVVPKVLLDAVDALVKDPERHDRVVLFLMGTKDFPRNHELTPILAATFGKDTPEKLDGFFVAAGKR